MFSRDKQNKPQLFRGSRDNMNQFFSHDNQNNPRLFLRFR
jgi:hypothetical protein